MLMRFWFYNISYYYERFFLEKRKTSFLFKETNLRKYIILVAVEFHDLLDFNFISGVLHFLGKF